MSIQLKGNDNSSFSDDNLLIGNYTYNSTTTSGAEFDAGSLTLQRPDSVGGDSRSIAGRWGADIKWEIDLNGSASFVGGRAKLASDGNFELYNGSNQVVAISAGDGSATFADGDITFGGTGAASFNGAIEVDRAAGTNTGVIIRENGTARTRLYADGSADFAGGLSINSGAISLNSNGTIVSAGTYTTTAPNARQMYVGNDGTFGGVSSVRESKKNIEYGYDSSWVLDLQPVSFNYRKFDKETQTYTEEIYADTQYGLIAQDVEEVNREVCNYDDGKLLGVEYMKLVTPILAQLQQALTRIEALEAEVQSFKGGQS